MMGSAKKGKSVEGRGVDVFGIALVQNRHGRGVLEIAILFRAVAIQNLDGVQVIAFAIRLRLCSKLASGIGLSERVDDTGPSGQSTLTFPAGLN